ncbi:recombinase family protein [Nonomuraea sp. NPDC026600]|uniref:recombinase family protein n=1 Tax=Nonomuraea sp. NPDC026600 TaxID=3155363 RepID=UPI0033D18FC8
MGYTRCSALTQELQSQLAALAAHGIGREKIFSEKISTRMKVRPQFEAALTLARQIKAHAPHCRVILTVYEMKRLGRDAAELTALADHMTAHGLVLEMLAGPLAGIYDPSGPDAIRLLRRHGRDQTRSHPRGHPGMPGRRRPQGQARRPPPVTLDDMLHTVLRRKAAGERVEDIRKDLIIPTGRHRKVLFAAGGMR